MKDPNEQLKEKDVETLVEALLEHVSSLNENQQLIVDSLVEGIDAKLEEVIVKKMNDGSLDDRIREIIKEGLANVES